MSSKAVKLGLTEIKRFWGAEMPGSVSSDSYEIENKTDRGAELTARSLLAARNFPYRLTHTAWDDWYPLTYL